jgi:ribose 5-phosphate isomerase A
VRAEAGGIGTVPYAEAKRAAARAAVRLVEPGTVVGVGSGSTVDFFVEELATAGIELAAAVPASGATAVALSEAGYLVVTLDEVELPIGLYVDGADAVDPAGRALKGGGGAHGGEKIVAYASSRWVCIVDGSKLVDALRDTRLPIPLEVHTEAGPLVARMVRALGGSVELRNGFTTDHGNPILDAFGLDLSDPGALELTLDAIPGVVECGLFARRPAELVLVGRDDGFAEEYEPGGS